MPHYSRYRIKWKIHLGQLILKKHLQFQHEIRAQLQRHQRRLQRQPPFQHLVEGDEHLDQPSQWFKQSTKIKFFISFVYASVVPI